MIAFIYIGLYTFYLAFFLWLICRWRFFSIEGISRKQLAVFFSLKVIAGVSLTLFYTFYYTDQSKADIYRYLNDSKVISSLLFKQPVIWLQVITGIGDSEPEVFMYLLPTLYFSHPETDIATNNSLIIRIISIFNLFSYCNIYINTLFFNFTSFIGLTILFKALRKHFEEFPALLYLPIYLLPSVVFWSSGMLKEQLVFALLGPFLSTAVCLKDVSKYKRWILLTFFLYLIYSIKPSIAVCLLISIFFLPVVDISLIRKIYLSVVGVMVLGGLSFLSDSSICELLINKRNEFVLLATIENAGSYLDSKVHSADCSHLITVVPKALFDVILRPLVWERGNVFQFLFAVENALFILLSCFLLIRYFRKPSESMLLAFFFFLFSFLNYLIIGITVPITGAIVHYRVIAAPFLLIGILLFTNHTVLKSIVSERMKSIKL